MDDLPTRLRASGLRDSAELAHLLESGRQRSVGESPVTVDAGELLRIYAVRAIHLASLPDEYARQLAGSAAEFVDRLKQEAGDSKLRGIDLREGADEFEQFIVWEAEDGRVLGCMRVQPTSTSIPLTDRDMYAGGRG